MCYSPAMERIGVRELRNQASRVVRRARAGERMIITVDGVPAAEIGPVSATQATSTIEGLIARGLVSPARVSGPPAPPAPVPAPSGRSTLDVLRELRGR
jgi:prevent-host-death family protein